MGFKHFKAFFTNYYFFRLLRNTLKISLCSLLTFPCPIILALLLNELKSAKFSKVAQTVTYIPHFISTVVVCSMVIVLTGSSGAIMQILHALFGVEEKAMLNNPAYCLPIYVLTELWQTLRWNSIIYLSALTGIDQQLYEAARVDGAGR